jgi:hypothetical protein
MDARRFDQIARTFSTASSRRGVLARLTYGLAVALPFARLHHAEAKKRPTKKRRKKGARRCIPDCAGKVCGDDGCGGACGVPCPDTRVCQGGTCVCAPGREECGGECPLQCGAGRARNPFTCSCCKTHGTTCAGMPDSGSCCSDNCPGTSCVSLPGGAACEFGAQCQSGDCNDYCADP